MSIDYIHIDIYIYILYIYRSDGRTDSRRTAGGKQTEDRWRADAGQRKDNGWMADGGWTADSGTDRRQMADGGRTDSGWTARWRTTTGNGRTDGGRWTIDRQTADKFGTAAPFCCSTSTSEHRSYIHVYIYAHR